MSFLRILSPSRNPPISTTRVFDENSTSPTLALHVPAYGVIYINYYDSDGETAGPSPESEAGGSSLRPTNERELNGHMEIWCPRGMGQKRVKAIRVGLRSMATMLIGGKKVEEVIYEKQYEIVQGDAGDVEGTWLEPGLYMYSFTIPLPPTLAPHDRHPVGGVAHNLYAELEGMPPYPPSSPSFLSFRSRTPGSTSRSRTPRTSPPLSPPDDHNAGPSITSSIRREAALPQTPAYEELESKLGHHHSRSERDGTWLKGVITTTRSISLCYNPHPTGGISDLDLRMAGAESELGVHNVHLSSDVWTVCAIFTAHVLFPSLQPTVTIFCVRILLSQRVEMTPSVTPEAEPIISQRDFIVVQQGIQPPPSVPYPGPTFDAIWRGTAAGGKDEGELRLQLEGRLPNDESCRPSTLPGIITPIRVSHQIKVQVFFSTYGSRDKEAKSRPLPGSLKMMSLERDVVVPNCAMIPEVLNLPSYSNLQTSFNNPFDSPCPLCKTPIESRLCADCPPSTPPHLRHDHPFSLVGPPLLPFFEEGTCRVCAESVLPQGKVGWRNCKCGFEMGHFDARMRKLRMDESLTEAGTGSGGEREEGGKVGERGRRGL